MGKYLIVDDRENNSKGVSSLMAYLIQILVKKENLDDGWALKVDEVAKIIANVKYLMEDGNRIEAFFEDNKDKYWCSYAHSLKEGEELLQTVFNIFSIVLAEAILDDKKLIYAYWE